MNVLSRLFGKSPNQPRVSAKPTVVNQKQSVVARDDLLKRLAKLRRATQVSQLTSPNIKRKQLGAGV